jgi:hypothetical protein
MDVTAGCTVTAIRTAGSTVSAAVPKMEPSVAVIVARPVDTAVAKPCDPEVFETVAVEPEDVDHVTVSVRFLVLRSE